MKLSAAIDLYVATAIPYGYCHCGCGGKTKIAQRTNAERGWVCGEPRKYMLGHRAKVGLPTEYIVDGITGCWAWQRALTPQGYGQTSAGLAHRLYYEKYVGPIPEGLHLDHLCRNRACVNPAHLEPVTCAENLRRGSHVKLNVEQVAEIRALRSAGLLQREIADRFGVSVPTVGHIVTGRSWRNV